MNASFDDPRPLLLREDFMEVVDGVLVGAFVGAFGFTAGVLVGFSIRSAISARRREAVRRRRALFESILAERSSASNVEDE